MQRVRHGEPGIRTAAEHRRAVFRPMPWGTAYGNSHKRNKRSGRGLLRLELELGCCAGALMSRSGGKADAAHAEEVAAGLLRSLGGMTRLVLDLGRCREGQGGPGIARVSKWLELRAYRSWGVRRDSSDADV